MTETEKQIALRLAKKVWGDYLGRLEYEVYEFASRFLDEIHKSAEPAKPVAWCALYNDPRMGPITSNPSMYEPQIDALVASCEGRIVKVPLYLHPPAPQPNLQDEGKTMFKHNCPHKIDGVCIECYQDSVRTGAAMLNEQRDALHALNAKIRRGYEELRTTIDNGSESMTHDRAVGDCGRGA